MTSRPRCCTRALVVAVHFLVISPLALVTTNFDFYGLGCHRYLEPPLHQQQEEYGIEQRSSLGDTHGPGRCCPWLGHCILDPSALRQLLPVAAAAAAYNSLSSPPILDGWGGG